MGVGITLGVEGGGVSVNAGVSSGRGNSDGRDSTWTQSTVTAGNVLALQSGGDTSLRGAVGQADQILASVGGNLLLESLQDTSTYQSKQSNSGFSGSVCVTCAVPGSIAGNVGRGKMNSDYASVTQQTGLKAGDGGFLIDVGGNTTLIGSVISSSQQAVADGLNHLSTGTLRVEDIRNHAEYSASQVSVGGGFSFGGGDQSSQNAVGRDKDGNVASGGQSVPGSSVPSDKSGLAMGLPVALSASGSASSTTRSGISEGVIEIRDEAGQQALTGKSAAETIASLNRDTTDTLGALKPIFDKEKIEAEFEIGTAFAGEMGQFLANRAKELDSAKARAGDETLSPQDRIAAAKEHAALEAKWGNQGTHSQWATIIMGAAGGNVTGGVSSFVQSATAAYLQTLAAEEVKELSKALGGEGSPGHIALHALVGCAGATGQGGACAAGAAGASASVVLNQLLNGLQGKAEGAESSQSRTNLIGSLVAGIAATLDGNGASAAALATRIETENNSQYRNQGKVAKLKAGLYENLAGSCESNPDRESCYTNAFQAGDRIAAAYDRVLTLQHYPAASMTPEQMEVFTQAVLDLAPGVSSASALYELINGRSAVTDEEVSRFFAAVGVIPVVGGMIKQGSKMPSLYAKVEHAVDAGKVVQPVARVGDELAQHSSIKQALSEADEAKRLANKPKSSYGVPENLNGYADPSQIRFTQDSIANKFKNDQGLQGVVDRLKNGSISPEDFPPIRVFKKDGLVYSLDNRRLLAASQAGVPVKIVPATAEEILKESWKFTTNNQGSIICIRGICE